MKNMQQVSLVVSLISIVSCNSLEMNTSQSAQMGSLEINKQSTGETENTKGPQNSAISNQLKQPDIEQEELAQDASNQDSQSFMSAIAPKYGNWCGPDHPKDIHNANAPVDSLDSACKRHDLCYETKGYLNCECDKKLNQEIVQGIKQKQYQRAEAVFARSIHNYFRASPCSGDHSSKIAPSRAVHNLIKKAGDNAVKLINTIPFINE